MSRGRVPPFPSGGDWRGWAQQLVEFLQDRGPASDENSPRPVLLAHQTDNEEEVAATDGILMYDPALDVPVYSLNGEWVPVGSANTWYYTTTDDAGDGTVSGDANATDYTGQDGASVAGCAQVDEGEVAYFSHKGQLYVYTGARPVSIGAGCADTAVEGDFTPFGGVVNWDDIQGKPATYPPDPHTHTLDEVPAPIAGDKAYWRVTDTWVEANYNKLAGVPTEFPPEAHTHTLSEIPAPIDDTKAYWRVNNGWLEADYTKLTNIPAEFPPETHTHTLSELPAPIDDTKAYWRVNNDWLEADYTKLTNIPAEFPPSAHTHKFIDLTDVIDTTYLGKENYVPRVVYDLFGAGQHGLQLVPPPEGVDEPADNINTYGREWDGAAGSWVPAVRKAGDTMTGPLTTPTDGLIAQNSSAISPFDFGIQLRNTGGSADPALSGIRRRNAGEIEFYTADNLTEEAAVIEPKGPTVNGEQTILTKEKADSLYSPGGKPTWYETRDDFVADVANHTWVDGEVVSAAGFSYLHKSSDTPGIADLTGWVPYGKAYLDHFGGGDGETAAANDAAIIDALDYVKGYTTYTKNLYFEGRSTYSFSAPIIITNNNVNLVGDAGRKAVLSFDASTVPDATLTSLYGKSGMVTFINNRTGLFADEVWQTNNGIHNLRINGNDNPNAEFFGVALMGVANFTSYNLTIDSIAFGLLISGGQQIHMTELDCSVSTNSSGTPATAPEEGYIIDGSCGLAIDSMPASSSDGSGQERHHVWTTYFNGLYISGGNTNTVDHDIRARSIDGMTVTNGYVTYARKGSLWIKPYLGGDWSTDPERGARQGVMNLRFFGVFFDGNTSNANYDTPYTLYVPTYNGGTSASVDFIGCTLGNTATDVFFFESSMHGLNRLGIMGCRMRASSAANSNPGFTNAGRIGTILGSTNSSSGGKLYTRVIIADTEFGDTQQGLVIDGVASLNISNARFRDITNASNNAVPLTLQGTITTKQVSATFYNCDTNNYVDLSGDDASDTGSATLAKNVVGQHLNIRQNDDAVLSARSRNNVAARLKLLRQSGTSYELANDTGFLKVLSGADSDNSATDERARFEPVGTVVSNTKAVITAEKGDARYIKSDGTGVSTDTLTIQGTANAAKLALVGASNPRDNFLDIVNSSTVRLAADEGSVATSPSILLRVKQHNHIEMDGLSTTITGNGAPALVIDGNTAFQSALVFNKAGDGLGHWRAYPANSTEALTFQSNSSYSYTMIKSGTPSGNNIMRASDVAAAYTSKASLLSLMVSKGLITQAEADTV